MATDDIGQETLHKIVEDCVGPTLKELAYDMLESGTDDGDNEDNDDDSSDDFDSSQSASQEESSSTYEHAGWNDMW
eukprot:CAMPEP_0116021042 /NCGR_PEP_ID=MMETSP0321-20121206/10152_1 /TAXON_ID=163516 /ORGANISM="Leptocylindrus danicus var. danicus, Strain B650" /LENGTH=75 /DNA_ID=CAMNT_0003491839 /DNA_START=257 /DNA_END=484 /DNA_ORIENTATION=+